MYFTFKLNSKSKYTVIKYIKNPSFSALIIIFSLSIEIKDNFKINLFMQI